MHRVLEFEQRADECRQLAVRTFNENQKRKLLEMAEAWDRLAQERREQLSERPANGHQLPHDTPTGGTTIRSSD